MDPADPQNSVLIPVVAGRCILLGSDSSLFVPSKLVLSSFTKRLYAVDSAWHSSNLRRDLTTANQAEYDTGADNECQDESVLAVCGGNGVSSCDFNVFIDCTYTMEVSSP